MLFLLLILSFEPTVRYNKMLVPMLPLTVKGVIWYQGESNVERPEQYRMLFPELVRTWRKYFADDNLPFYYVQIAPYNHQKVNSAIFREVQLDCMRTIPNVGMVVTLDVGEADIIHPARKEVVGERLAYWALNKVFGETKDLRFGVLKLPSRWQYVMAFQIMWMGHYIIQKVCPPLRSVQIIGNKVLIIYGIWLQILKRK